MLYSKCCIVSSAKKGFGIIVVLLVKGERLVFVAFMYFQLLPSVSKAAHYSSRAMVSSDSSIYKTTKSKHRQVKLRLCVSKTFSKFAVTVTRPWKHEIYVVHWPFSTKVLI
jgi:hypothetical protein